MLNYKSILIIAIISIATSKAAQLSSYLPPPPITKKAIQDCIRIGSDPRFSIASRLWHVDKLVTYNHLSQAAVLYKRMLSDDRINTDLDWKMLVIEGLAKCGAPHKGKAILSILAIYHNPNLTKSQKETAKDILAEIQSTLIFR